MRVAGVDPGLTRCGLGAVDGAGSRRAEFVAVDVLRTPADMTVDLRLLRLADGIEQWFERYIPDVVAVERVFAQHNTSTMMGTAQVAGLAMLAAARRGVPVALHTPSEVKAAVTGNGRAGKDQVARMVTRILNLDETPKVADASDALALAITHLWRPAGALQGGDQHEVTPAQRKWAAAEAAARTKRKRGRR
jgi:crossover junction endodeoxyribonuclease RuvC